MSNFFLVLHPKHKLKYFEKQGWDDTWITTAKEIVKEEFKKNYAAYAIRKEKKVSNLSTKACFEFNQSIKSLKRSPF